MEDSVSPDYPYATRRIAMKLGQCFLHSSQDPSRISMVRNLHRRKRTTQPFPESLLPRTYERASLSQPEPDVPYVVMLLQALHQLEGVRRREDDLVEEED